jgi:hypothetical protein
MAFVTTKTAGSPVRTMGSAFALVLLTLAAAPHAARAQAADDKQALEQKVDALTKALAALQARMDAMEKSAAPASAGTEEDAAARDAAALKRAAAQPASTTTAASRNAVQAASQSPAVPAVAPGTRPGSTTPSVSGIDPDAVHNLTLGATQPTTAEQAHHRFFERKPGRDLTFYTKAGEITLYGNLDVSVDTATKGTRGLLDGNGNPPVGNMGWLEDISTNLAYVGVRGTQMTGIKDTNFIFQLETSVNISTAPGLHESNRTRWTALCSHATATSALVMSSGVRC